MKDKLEEYIFVLAFIVLSIKEAVVESKWLMFTFGVLFALSIGLFLGFF